VAITDLPLLSMLRTRMQWSQARQQLIAENVANADMPGFRPRDLAALSFGADGTAAKAGVGLAATAAGHIVPAGADGPGADAKRFKGFEVRPSGNGVNLEEEMMKAGDNQSDYQLAASLYQKSLDTLKIAIGKR
jgi:flagellar basal-body rod protein FlgB